MLNSCLSTFSTQRRDSQGRRTFFPSKDTGSEFNTALGQKFSKWVPQTFEIPGLIFKVSSRPATSIVKEHIHFLFTVLTSQKKENC